MADLEAQLRSFLEKLTFETDHPDLEIPQSPEGEFPSIGPLMEHLQEIPSEKRPPFLTLLEKISLKLGERIAQLDEQKALNRNRYFETEAQLRATQTSLMPTQEKYP